MTESLEFGAEQSALERSCWQLVALRSSLAAPNAWIRRSFFGRDVFVQSFDGRGSPATGSAAEGQRGGVDGELRAFHNVCAHRGFPLRTEPAGAGPVQCGFHGWVYNRDGIPTGVPRNKELFQLSRERQRELALAPIRVETIGRFVFVGSSANPLSLRSYLGAYADVLAAIDALASPDHVEATTEVAADWKLHAEITLDDYHLASVHPQTFGAIPPQPLHTFYYRRDGVHSCYLRRRDPDWSFESFFAELARGAFDRTGYKIFNLFPAALVSASPAGVVVTVADPLAPRRSAVRHYGLGWADDPDPQTMRSGFEFHLGVAEEDRVACERWQQAVDSLAHPPVLGALETRVGWFRENVAAICNHPSR